MLKPKEVQLDRINSLQKCQSRERSAAVLFLYIFTCLLSIYA